MKPKKNGLYGLLDKREALIQSTKQTKMWLKTQYANCLYGECCKQCSSYVEDRRVQSKVCKITSYDIITTMCLQCQNKVE